MIKLYDTGGGYIEAEVAEFYSNDYPQYFARTGKGTYFRAFDAPIYAIPDMVYGSMPRDGGNLIIEAEDYDDFIGREPAAKKWIRPYVGSREFIHKLPRWCLWLVDCPPNELRKMPSVYKRVQAVKDFRSASKRTQTQRDAETPWLFAEIRQPKTDYLLVPRVSSERREYVPIGYMPSEIICSDANLMIPDAMYWHFGVLTSRPHMTWMRAIGGRLRNDYRYSAEAVYNPFPWPPFNREVERTAAEILAVRQRYPDATFADLYDPLIMPKDLRRAHEANDRAVMEAYDFPRGISEHQMLIDLMNMYQRLANFIELLRDE